MNFIVYDLEASCWEGSPPSMVSEIIEIGAVLVNRYGEVETSFNKFVKPVVNRTLSVFCKNLTSISQEMVDRASNYPDVIEEFQDWAGIFEEEYLLCSWGSFDRKMLIQDCQLHQLEWEWAEQHINLKRQYHEINRLRRTRGLKYTVEKEGFDFTGTHHRGIADAENLAKVFSKYVDEWRY